MAQEEDLKKVDLKVTANCCEGCKRKVRKALSIKGVLKTEIHPSLPKITVTGNVDVPTLIKKLAKCGKAAELWSSDAPTPAKEKEEAKADKKSSRASGSRIVQVPEKEGDDDHGKGKNSANSSTEDTKSASSCETAVFTTSPPVGMPPAYVQGYYPMQQPVSSVPAPPVVMPPSYVQGYYPMQQQAVNSVPLPCYAMNVNAYAASPPCVHDHHFYCQMMPTTYQMMPAVQPQQQQQQQQQQGTGFGDYFNDENTMGCHVM